MTSEEFQSKCVQISHFIHYELSNWIDLAVFTQNSFEDLGELYYQHILSHVDMASIDLINRVVKQTLLSLSSLSNKQITILHYVNLCD